MESLHFILKCIGTMNPPLTPPGRGTDKTQTNARSPLGRGRGWVGSWKAPFRFFECMGIMNLSVGRHLFGVPPSGGPNRLKPGLRTGGSWKAAFRCRASIGTMNKCSPARVTVG